MQKGSQMGSARGRARVPGMRKVTTMQMGVLEGSGTRKRRILIRAQKFIFSSFGEFTRLFRMIVEYTRFSLKTKS